MSNDSLAAEHARLLRTLANQAKARANEQAAYAVELEERVQARGERGTDLTRQAHAARLAAGEAADRAAEAEERARRAEAGLKSSGTGRLTLPPPRAPAKRTAKGLANEAWGARMTEEERESLRPSDMFANVVPPGMNPLQAVLARSAAEEAENERHRRPSQSEIDAGWRKATGFANRLK